MKKILLALLVLFAIGGIMAAAATYFLYRAASGVFDNARSYVESMSELGELDKRIVNQARHLPPASGELTEDQVERFARVQDHVRTALGQRFGEIEKKYEHLKVNAVSGEQPSMAEMMVALGDLANLFVQARRFQVDALNQERFSQAEYSWVRDRIFQAAGVHVTSTIDLRKLEESLKQSTGLDNLSTPPLPTIEVPAKNRELIKPHLEKMDGWIPLVFFGL